MVLAFWGVQYVSRIPANRVKIGIRGSNEGSISARSFYSSAVIQNVCVIRNCRPAHWRASEKSLATFNHKDIKAG